MELTSNQRAKLEDLWMIYGNNGPKGTHANHRFLQCILENGEWNEKFYKPDKGLVEKVKGILSESD